MLVTQKKIFFNPKKYKFSKIYFPPKNSFFNYRTHRHTQMLINLCRQKNASAHSSSSTQLCARVRERKLFKPNPIFDRNFVSVLVLLLLLLSWYSVYINFTWCFYFILLLHDWYSMMMTLMTVFFWVFRKVFDSIFFWFLLVFFVGLFFGVWMDGM